MKRLFLLIIILFLNSCSNRYEKRIIEIHNSQLPCEEKEWLIKAVRDLEKMDPDNFRFQLRESLKKNREEFEEKYSYEK